MNSDDLRTLLDTCFMAKKITEAMKELPKGMKRRHIHVIEAVSFLSTIQEEVRVSDVSHRLNVTTPSVTKLIKELEKLQVIEKFPQKDDKRVILLKLTDLGQRYYKEYVEDYHDSWAAGIIDVTKEEIQTVVSVIEKLNNAMPQE